MDAGAFESFVAANFEPVRRALALALGDPDRAEDLAQEAFARAFGRWAAVSAMERPVAWVYVVALNHARRDLRQEHRPWPWPPPVAAAVAEVDTAGAVTTSVSLASALALLPVRQRTAVVLRYLADLTNAQVAEAMGCAEGTVKATIHAALAHLRIELEDDEL